MTDTPSTALTRGARLELYRQMWVLRLLDMALEEAHIGGLTDDAARVEFGQEAVAVGAVAALRPGDIVHATSAHYRRAETLATGQPLGPAIAEMIGPRRGSPKTGDWKQTLANESVLGQSTLFALGDANAQRLAGAGNISVCVIGGRDAHSVEFAAAAKIAVSWRLPVVFVVENIRGGPNARRRAYESDAMPMLPVDGRDVAVVADSVAEAVRMASGGSGPALVEAITYRTSHPIALDPLVFAHRQLTAAGVDGDHLYEVECRARRLVAEALSAAQGQLGRTPPAHDPNPWSAAS